MLARNQHGGGVDLLSIVITQSRTPPCLQHPTERSGADLSVWCAILDYHSHGPLTWSD